MNERTSDRERFSGPDGCRMAMGKAAIASRSTTRSLGTRMGRIRAVELSTRRRLKRFEPRIVPRRRAPQTTSSPPATSNVLRGEEWPHGEWGHAARGVWEYYSELLDTHSRPLIRRFLIVLAYPNRTGRVECPCGSRRKLHKCCRERVADLRKKISPRSAKHAISVLGLTVPSRKY